MIHWRLMPRQLKALLFTDFRAMFESWLRIENRISEIDRINSVRGAWLQGAGGEMTLGKFCEKFGIIEKVETKIEKVETKKLYKMADKITEQCQRYNQYA